MIVLPCVKFLKDLNQLVWLVFTVLKLDSHQKKLQKYMKLGLENHSFKIERKEDSKNALKYK